MVTQILGKHKNAILDIFLLCECKFLSSGETSGEINGRGGSKKKQLLTGVRSENT